MSEPSDQTRLLERVLLEQGVPPSHVKPWWVSLYRRLGLQPKPPVLFTLAEHFLWVSPMTALIVLVGGAISVTLLDVRLDALAVPLSLIVAVPVYNWLRFRKARQRFTNRQ